MKVPFIEVEPYNNTGRPPQEAQKFCSRIPRNCCFEFDGSVKPKCMLLDSVVYKERIGSCIAKGVLMAIDLDTYFEQLDAGSTHSELVRSYGVGEIQIDYRSEDYPTQPQVTARPRSF